MSQEEYEANYFPILIDFYNKLGVKIKLISYDNRDEIIELLNNKMKSYDKPYNSVLDNNDLSDKKL